MKTYAISLGGRDIIFRELNLGEWGNLKNERSGFFDLYATVAKFSVLHPKYEDLEVGEILFLGELILEKSKRFSDEGEISREIEYIVSNMETSPHLIPILICRAFPAYKPEDVMAWDFETFVTRMAQVQYMNDVKPNQDAPVGNLENQSIAKSKSDLARAMRKRRGL